MRTYLQIVNDTILESGADLDTFAEDGSDFNALGHDSLMYKFKTWVNRAWQTIQQNAYDWEFMSEQAVVNINPGIMFYSPNIIDWTPANVNPLIIYDVDDTAKITGETVTKVVNLTGLYTNTENFGYVDLLSNPSHPISFGMKSGGEYFNATTAPAGLSEVIVVEDGSKFTVGELYPITMLNGYVANVRVTVIDGNLLTIVGNSVLDTLVLMLVLSNTVSTVDNDSSVQNVTVLESFKTWREVSPQVASQSLYLRSFWNIPDGYLDELDVISIRATDPFTSEEFFDIPNAGTIGYVITDPDPGPLVAMYIALTEEAAAQLAAFVPPANDYINLYLTRTSDNRTMEVVGSPEVSIYFLMDAPPLTRKNYIHSWKSYDWAEETQNDDFVEDLAELDEQSFRLVTHEIPAPGLEIKLPFLHWEIFRTRYDNATVPPSQPRIITKDSVGRFRFYPAPDVPYTILFDYVRNPQKLVAFGDVPKKLPEDLTDIIMWRALMYYGEYDEQPSVVARATRNYKDLLSRLELRFRDKFHFSPYKLW